AHLRRLHRDHGRRAPPLPGSPGQRPGPAQGGRGDAVLVPLHRGPARPRPADPHERRDADLELPALANRLLGDLGHGRAVARFPPPAPAAGHRGLPEARAPLRRHHRGLTETVERGTRSPGFLPNLMRRVLTAAVALPALLAVLFLGPPALGMALVAGALALGLVEFYGLLRARELKPLPAAGLVAAP